MFGEWRRAVNPAHTLKYLGKNVQIRIPILSAHLPQNEDLEDKQPVVVVVAVALLRPANYLFGLVLKWKRELNLAVLAWGASPRWFLPRAAKPSVRLWNTNFLFSTGKAPPAERFLTCGSWPWPRSGARCLEGRRIRGERRFVSISPPPRAGSLLTLISRPGPKMLQIPGITHNPPIPRSGCPRLRPASEKPASFRR